MKRYHGTGYGHYVEKEDGRCFMFEDVQQLARDVLPRIAHKEDCIVIHFGEYTGNCDCGHNDLKARLQKIIEGAP